MKIDAPLLAANPLDAREIAQQLERDGYAGVYTFDGPHDPFLPLAIAAEHSQRLQLITAIAVAFARNPMLLAQLGNDLQLMSKGRVLLGLGSQIRPHIEKRFSMPWSMPAARMREFVLAVRAIWAAWQGIAPLNFRGEFYTHTLMPPLLTPGPNPYGPPPILLAGVGPRMTEVAGEVADGFLVHPFHTAAYFEHCILPALQVGFKKSGRQRENFEISCQLLVATGQTSAEVEQAVRELRVQIAFYASTPAYRPVLEQLGRGALQGQLSTLTKQGEWAAMADLIDDEILHAVAIVGTIPQAAEAILKRCAGQVERISPTAYIRDPAAASALMRALQTSIETA